MKTRDKSYDSYGLGEDDIERAYSECRRPENFYLLFSAAQTANPDISVALAFSLAYNVSYDKLESWCYIPYSKGDFYAYRRKTLAIFLRGNIQLRLI